MARDLGRQIFSGHETACQGTYPPKRFRHATMHCHIGSFYFLKPQSLPRLENGLTTPNEHHASFRGCGVAT